jgi:ABC-type glycerol-3-phosphate transport system substrate-binding protein
VLTGCTSGNSGSSASTASSSGAGGTINVVVLGDTTEPSMQTVLDDYEKANPGYTINPVPIPLTTWPDFLSVLQTRLAGGADYDAVYLPTEGQLTLASRGVLRPLDDFIASDKQFMDDYYADLPPAMLEAFNAKENVDGHTYFVPHLVNAIGIWYNKKVFDAAGVAYPKADWTWSDFLATAKSLRDPENNVYAFNIAPDLFQGLDPWLSTNGASVLDDDWAKSTVDSPEAVEAVTFARSLVADDLVPSPGGTFDQYGALANGKLAMMGAGIWGVASFASLGGTDDLGIVPWPQQTQNGSPMGLGAFGVLDKSTKADQAWHFIKWLASPEGQSKILTLGAQPVRTSIQNSQEYRDQLPDGGEYLDQALGYAHLIVGVEQGGEIGTAIQDSWNQMLLGNASPEDGLADLSSTIDGILAG